MSTDTFSAFTLPSTDPATAQPFTLKIVQWSCQKNAGKSLTQIAWQDMHDWIGEDPALIIGQGDTGYWSAYIVNYASVAEHQDKYRDQFIGLPAMLAMLEAAATIWQRDDHDGAPSGNNDDSYNSVSFATNLIAMTTALPYGVFLDPTKKSIYNEFNIGPNIAVAIIDSESTERSPGMMADGPTKTFLGGTQKPLVQAFKQRPEPVKVIVSPKTTQGSEAPSSGTKDKWEAYPTERAQIFGDFTGDVWSGDVHRVCYTPTSLNPVGPYSECTASAVEQHGLKLDTGQAATYEWHWGDDPNNELEIQVYGRITLSDDMAGTVTRTFVGWDAGNQVERGSSTRVWSYSAQATHLVISTDPDDASVGIIPDTSVATVDPDDATVLLVPAGTVNVSLDADPTVLDVTY